jgi:hypothetical protein
MSILTEIIGGNVGQLFKDIVGSFKLSPEKEAELLAIAEQNKNALAVKQLDLEAKAEEVRGREIEAASRNIVAEATSSDKFTSRARPAFMYVVNCILLWNYIAVPMFKREPVTLPEALFWLFGSAVLGYTGARTWEKIGVKK